ncbi:MAG: prepilin-type N-terminal cleavage/methylation domain-containing protein [Candidatus Nomurabacteria bacterium]|nr:prepilin-type N-terminal cleavage/methylation domain-containing protein [Candidatus Nomurabacteria bacterium]
MSEKYFKKNNGFTLIEIMVSMSIFMIVVLMALGALLVVSGTAKKSRALHQTMDNINFAMESMTRSLRTGTDYSCIDSGDYVILPLSYTADCSFGGDAIAFRPQNSSSSDTMYLFDHDKSVLKKCTISGCVNMTSPNVVVDDLKFFVKGTGSSFLGDYTQPSVFIRMSGYVMNGENKEQFYLQTMASQRSAE